MYLHIDCVPHHEGVRRSGGMVSRNRNVHFSGGEWVTFTPAALPLVKKFSQSQFRRDV